MTVDRGDRAVERELIGWMHARSTDLHGEVTLDMLIVEDNVIFRQTFKGFLRDRHPATRIEEAGDAEEAMRKIDACIPDLIFMDIKLPGMNGLQLTSVIKARHPGIRIVVVTSLGEPELREAALARGADGFFTKDRLNDEEFRAMLESVSSNAEVSSNELPLDHSR